MIQTIWRYIQVLTITLLLCVSTIALPNSSITPLPVDEAFLIHALKKENNTIELRWHISPGYQLYQDSIHVSNAAITHLPIADNFIDSQGIARHIYKHTITLNLSRLQNANTPLQVAYQGCHGTQQCYPPQIKTFNLNTANQWMAPSSQHTLPNMSIIGFFLSGLLLAFTPCVLPMLPILAGILFGQNNLTHRKSFFIALSYVISMALTYAVTGAIAANLGHTIQAAMQTPLVIYTFSAILIAMGFIMLTNTQLSWLSGQASTIKISANQWYTPILLGVSATLITSPCITPVFIGGLSYIASTGDVLLGTIDLFAMGVGMGIPILLIAMLGTNILPKSGPWLNVTKIGSGIILMMTAIWISSRIMSPSAIGITIAIITLVCVSTLFKQNRKLATGSGMAGLLALIMLMPWQNEITQLTSQSMPIITTLKQLEPIIQTALSHNKKVILNFSASWCSSCHQLDKTIFQNPTAISSLTNTTIITVDISKQDANANSLMTQFHVFAPPTTIIIHPNHSQQALTGMITLQQLQNSISQSG